MIFLYSSFEAGGTWLTYVVPFATAELGHKCLEAAAIQKLEPLQLHLCVWIIKIFKCHASEHLLAVTKDEKNLKNQNGGLKVPLFDLYVMFRCQNLFGSLHVQLIVPSTLLALQHTSKETRPPSHKDTYGQTTDISAFFFK